MAMQKDDIYSYEQLNSATSKLLKACKEQKGNEAEWLDHQHKFFNQTPLLHCVFNRYKATDSSDEKAKLLELAIFIISKGANPNVKNSNSTPLFHRAIKNKFHDFVSILIKSGRIDYSLTQLTEYKTATQVCLDSWPENTNLLAFLSQNNKYELQDILLIAIDEEDKEKIVYFIKNKLIDFNQANSDGLLPFNLLCATGNIEFINLVLDVLDRNEIEIEFNKRDAFDNNALHIACNPINRPNLKIIECLLKNNVDPNCPNGRGDTPLHFAVESNNPDLLRLLFRYKARADIINQNGLTPLMKVMVRPELIGRSQCLQILMSQNTQALPVLDSLNLAYQKGFWIRQISAYARTDDEAIAREIAILEKRENLTDMQLSIHNPEYDVNINQEFSFSPATLVKAGIPVGLFNRNEGYGVIIQTDRVIPAWCSGLEGQVMTDAGSDVNFHSNILRFKYAEEHQSVKVSTAEIALQYHRLVTERQMRLGSALERYKNITCLSWDLPYNEGLFRYKKSDIAAIYVGSSPKDAYYAIQLRDRLKLSVPFVSYQGSGLIERLDDGKVLEKAKAHDPFKQNKFAALFELPKSQINTNPTATASTQDSIATKPAAVMRAAPKNSSHYAHRNSAVLYKPAVAKTAKQTASTIGVTSERQAVRPSNKK